MRRGHTGYPIASLVGDFPSFSEGLSLRPKSRISCADRNDLFPFLFGGTFIEALNMPPPPPEIRGFPFLFGGTFIEAPVFTKWPTLHGVFPFLFGGTFIEASQAHENSSRELMAFPFLFGGTFIEAPPRS